jgi:hypothetical protein
MPSFVISCREGDSCQVYFEPHGSQHTLVRGDAFLVQPPASALDPVEVSYVAGGISVMVMSDELPRVTNAAGAELRL